MSVIEQAAKRLDELRRAGVSIPGQAAGDPVRADPVRAHPAAVRGTLGGPDASALPAGDCPSGGAGSSKRVELDLARIASLGIVTPDAPRSQVADEFRVIKRPLIANATARGAAPVTNGNLIMVTSAVPGEGKSFTAANLAMSIAMELDHTVLLVDADVARPSLPATFGMSPDRGLLDVLVDDAIDLGQVLLKTNVEKLSILQSGTRHARATELLASDGMADLLKEMATRYSDRIIIFDSPPLLVTTEARVLASRMGQVVMVVQAERTVQRDVRHALEAIESCPVKLMVLNKVPAAARESYGYGYGYGYGG